MLIFKNLPVSDYDDIVEKMRHFTLNRDGTTPDEVWFTQHFPVYTFGTLADLDKEVLNSDTSIPFVKTDRGGKITYHGPGQLVAYMLIDIKRLSYTTKTFVSSLERIVLNVLQHFGISGHLMHNAPGVYVNNAKIASLGLRLKHFRSYHGISINVDTSLEPFSNIVPCGLTNIPATRMIDHVPDISIIDVQETMQEIILNLFQQHSWKQNRNH